MANHVKSMCLRRAGIVGLLMLAALTCGADPLAEARQAAQAGDYARAIPLFVNALRNGADASEVMNDFALASFLAGNSMDAAMALEAMHLQGPLDTQQLNALGECYYRLSKRGDLQAVFGKRAAEMCDMILEENPPEGIAKAVNERKREILDAGKARTVALVEDVLHTEDASPKDVYSAILLEFDGKWLTQWNTPDGTGIDEREVALLADPAIVKFGASAGGIVGKESPVALSFFPTYPAAGKYMGELTKRVGQPDRTQARPGGTYRFSFYGSCAVISDGEGNVWGLIQRVLWVNE